MPVCCDQKLQSTTRAAPGDPVRHGGWWMSGPPRAANTSLMAAPQVVAALAQVEQATRRCEEMLAKVQHAAVQRGGGLPEQDVATLRQLPTQIVLQVLNGLDAPSVRSPGALLRWKLGQPNVQAALRLQSQQSATPQASGASTQPAVASPGTGPGTEASIPGSAVTATPVSGPTPSAAASPARSEATPLMELTVRCPGCGFDVAAQSTRIEPPSTPFRAASMMAFTSAWGQHECGASWMCTRLPRGFGTGIGLSAWLLRRAAPSALTPRIPSPMLNPGLSPPARAGSARDDGLEHSAWPSLHCWMCGGLFEHAIFAPGLTVDKVTVQWECCVCGLALVGCMENDADRCHVTAFWVEPADR